MLDERPVDALAGVMHMRNPAYALDVDWAAQSLSKVLFLANP